MKSFAKLRQNSRDNLSSVVLSDSRRTKGLPARASLASHSFSDGRAQAGEVATLMTIITMGIMLVGVIIGFQLSSNRPLTTGSNAQTQPTPTPSVIPTPTGVPVPTGSSTCLRLAKSSCSATFTYTCDPIIINAWLQNPGNAIQTMYLHDGLPTAVDIKGEFIGVNFNPAQKYPSPNQGLNGQIVVSVKSNVGTPIKYFGYNTRPDWVSGANPVDFYIQYQKRADRQAGNGISYVEKASMAGGCFTPTPSTVTPTPSSGTPTPSSGTPTPSSPTPSTITPPIPTVVQSCGGTCQKDSDCGNKLICYKQGDADIDQSIGVCRAAACPTSTTCKCEITPTIPITTGTETHCSIKSVAYVNECVDQSCSRTVPVEQANKNSHWGILNDKQYDASPRPQPAPFNIITDQSLVLRDTLLPIVAHFFEEKEIAFTPDRIKNVLARITENTPIRLPYKPGEDVKARLFYDKSAYQLFEKGIKTCRWNKDPRSKSEDEGWKCPSVPIGKQQPTYGGDDTNNEKTTIEGIRLACNREYEFGWTLQRCDPLDIFFVIDASMSMSEPDQNGQRKIDLAKDALKEYIRSTNLELHRAALIQFNRQATTLVPLTHDSNQLLAGVEKVTQAQYTRIDLGLAKAFDEMLQSTQQGHQRLVVLVSDGVPDTAPDQSPNSESTLCKNMTPTDCFNKSVKETDLKANKIKEITNKKTNLSNVLLITVGLGNPEAINVPGKRLDEFLTGWASADPKNPGKKLTYNTNTDPNLGHIFNSVIARVDQCAATVEKQNEILKAVDINGDGVVNTIDYFMVLDVYLARGQNLPEDVNADGVVNAFDLSLVIERIGISVSN